MVQIGIIQLIAQALIKKRHISMNYIPFSQHGASLVLSVLLLPLDDVVALAAQSDVRDVGDLGRHRTVLVVVKRKLVLVHGRRALLLLAQAVGGDAGGHGAGERDGGVGGFVSATAMRAAQRNRAGHGSRGQVCCA